MTEIPESHPRAASLRLRKKMIAGFQSGLATEAGLLAHGRGEAFDYLLGEKTQPFAESAIAATSAMLLLAEFPVMSVNGNAASLATEQISRLSQVLPHIAIEVNLFYRSEERIAGIVDHLKANGVRNVLSADPANCQHLPGIESHRAMLHPQGMGQSDCVLVALEDGDRCEALVNSGRKVISIDLNPLSRTAQATQVTIVDELTRAMSRLCEVIASDLAAKAGELQHRIDAFENSLILNAAARRIREGADQRPQD